MPPIGPRRCFVAGNLGTDGPPDKAYDEDEADHGSNHDARDGAAVEVAPAPGARVGRNGNGGDLAWTYWRPADWSCWSGIPKRRAGQDRRKRRRHQNSLGRDAGEAS